jgi:hypothetical protein
MPERKSADEREAELDEILASLSSGVERIKKKTRRARDSQSFSRKELADSPPQGLNIKQLKKTRMVFMAMAEESLEDSRQPDDEFEELPAKEGKLTKIDRRPVPRAAAAPRARPAAAAPPPSRPHPRPMAGG